MARNTSCAILTNGEAYCWGENTGGLVGSGSANTSVLSPERLSFWGMVSTYGYSVDSIRMGYYTNCARLTHPTNNAQLFCWGSNRYAVLGAGLEPAKYPNVYTPHRVQLGNFFDVKDFDFNLRHGCAINQWGNIACWGGRIFGQLGAYTAAIQGDEFDEVGDRLNKVKLETGRTVRHIVSSATHTCAILGGADDGKILCFGSNASGRLGRGLAHNHHIGDNHNERIDDFVFDLGGKRAVQLKSISRYNLAIDEDGGLWGWGSNAHALARGLVLSVNSDTNIPVQIEYPKPVVDISTGFYFACLADIDGDVYCWGSNWGDMDGNGSQDTVAGQRVEGMRGQPAGINQFPSISTDRIGGPETKVNLSSTHKVVALSSGASHTCALFDNQRVKCWGANNYGQLGIGDTDINGDGINDPVGDQTEEMGDNLFFLRLGTDGDSVELPVRKITTGYYHSCALFVNGRVKCWGRNQFGQLGLTTTDSKGLSASEMGNSLAFVELGSGVTAIDIQAGAYNTCAVLNNNDVKCWGNNTAGQLGIGDRFPAGHNPDRMGALLPKIQFPRPVGEE